MCDFLENVSADNAISKLYLKDDLSDVNFVFKGDGPTVLVPAHKLILASGSPVFRTMFFGSLPEKDTVEIVDATVGEFKEFLQLFYLRRIKLTMDNMEGVNILADKYDMMDSLKACTTSLKSLLTDDNIFWGYQLAMTLDFQALKQLCERKISCLPADIFKTDAFLNCDQNVLKNTLMMDELACDEIDIFEACVEWAKTACRKNELDENDAKNLKEQLGDFIYLIEFGKMTKYELGKILDNKLYVDIFDRDELLEITRISLLPNFEPKIFKSTTRNIHTFSTNQNLELVFKFNSNPYRFGYHTLRSIEPFSFTSNTSLLLGKIDFSLDRIGQFNTDFDFDIINCNTNEILCSGKTNNLKYEVDLDKRVFIKQQDPYMIRAKIPSNLVGNRVNTAFVNQNYVQSNPNIIIKFHRNSDTENSDSVLVSSMSFKQV